MSRPTFPALLLCCSLAAPAFAQAPRPSSRPSPATRPSAATRPTSSAPARVRDAMFNGAIRYLVPADWELTKRGEDGQTVSYTVPNGRGTVSLQVTPQQQNFPMGNAALKQKMAQAVLKAVGDDLKKRNVEVLDPPKLERDEAFIARLVYRFTENGTTVRAMHAYRGSGITVVSVTAAVPLDDAAQAKAVHDAAAMLLMSVSSGPADPKLVRPVAKE